MSDTQAIVEREKGIIYVAAGERHLREALESIESVKAAMPNVLISLFTDQKNVSTDKLDMVLPLASPTFSFADKILPLLESPYEKTLYLDTDTYMVQSCDGIFLMLEKYELMAAHDPFRSEFKFEKLPDVFPTFNTGVIGYRKTPAVRNFIKEWSRNYWERFVQKHKTDQPAFRPEILCAAAGI